MLKKVMNDHKAIIRWILVVSIFFLPLCSIMVKDNIDETMRTIFLKESQLDLFTLVRAFLFVAVVQMTFIYALIHKTFRTFLLSKK